MGLSGALFQLLLRADIVNVSNSASFHERASKAAPAFGRGERFLRVLRSQGVGPTSSASFAATVSIGFSAVLRPVREASIGLTSRSASYVVPCTTGMSWSRARSTESSLSAILSPLRRCKSAGVTRPMPGPGTSPTPLSISPQERRAEWDILLTEPDRDTACLQQVMELLCNSRTVIPRMAEEEVLTFRHDRKLFPPSHGLASAPALSAGEYSTGEPAGDQRSNAETGPPPLLRLRHHLPRKKKVTTSAAAHTADKMVL